MIDKAIRSMVLLAVTMGLSQSGVLGGEPLPARALARIGDYRFYHGPGITCAVLSPDGNRAASAAHYTSSDYVTEKEREAYDSTIVLWDTATGERIRELRVPHDVIACLAFTPNGKQLAAAYAISRKKFGVALFNVETGKLFRRLSDFQKGIHDLQFSINGKQMRVSEWLGAVSAWDIATGKKMRLWKPPPGVPPRKNKEGICAASGVLSPDGKIIVWQMRRIEEGGFPDFGEGLRVHDAVTNKLLYQIKFKPSHDSCSLEVVDFSADGKRFVIGFGDDRTVWDAASGKKVRDLEIAHPFRIVLSPDGRRAAILGEDFRLHLCDIETGKPSRRLLLGDSDVTSPLMFSADGKTLLFASDSRLRLFDTTIGKERAASAHFAPVTTRFSTDGQTLFTSCDKKSCRWDVSSADRPTLRAQEPRKIWDDAYPVYSADDRLFLDRAEDRFQVRETATGRVLCKLEKDDLVAVLRQISSNAARVLLGGPKNEGAPGLFPDLLRLYDAKTGKKSGTIELVAPASYPVFSSNGLLFAWVDRVNTIHLHDTVTGKVVRTLRSSRPLPRTEGEYADLLIFSPDSEYLIVGWPKLPLRVFHISSGREIARFYANAKKVSEDLGFSCLAWSPDNRLLALAEEGSGTIRLLEIASGQMRVEFAGHRHGVHGLAFAPDGKTLASGGEDHVVFLWDVTGARTGTAATKPSDNELSAWWNDMASGNAKRAGAAVASLIRAPEQRMALLQQRLHPAEAVDEKRLTRWLAELDDDAFKTREAASRELTRFGERAEAALRRALKNRPSLEVRRRIEDLLNKLEPNSPPPETLRALRAIEILEHAGTPAARRCLETLAKGAADARSTHAAIGALDRLMKRR